MADDLEKLKKEKEDVSNLVTHVEDEYRSSNISEKNYHDLKERYSKRLIEIEKKISEITAGNVEGQKTEEGKKEETGPKKEDTQKDSKDEKENQEEKKGEGKKEEKKEEDKKGGFGFIGKLFKKGDGQKKEEKVKE